MHIPINNRMIPERIEIFRNMFRSTFVLLTKQQSREILLRIVLLIMESTYSRPGSK